MTELSSDTRSETVQISAAEDASRGVVLGLRLLRLGPVLILLIIFATLCLASPYFLTSRNIGNVLAQISVISIIAMGQYLVILTRGIDLSVGSTLALSSVVGAIVFAGHDSSTLVILAMLLTGAGVGAINGIVFVFGRLPHPFIITLATLSIAKGAALLLADGRAMPGMPALVTTLGGKSIGILPYSAMVVVVAAIVLALFMRYVVWGRWIVLVGGNEAAAQRAGIPTRSILVSVYVLSGLSAGIGAVLLSGRTGAGSPLFGQLAELDAIAAVIIGGASFLGGRGTVGNALIGALMIGLIRNGLNLLNVQVFYQLIAIGIVVVIAVELDVLRGYLERRYSTLHAAAPKGDANRG